MRAIAVFLVSLAGVGSLPAQKADDQPPPARYGFRPDLKSFPQGTPREALASVLKAVERNRIGYLLAELANPTWVDERVRTVHGGKFEGLVKETEDQFAHDPGALKTLERMLKDGTWKQGENTAEGRLKGTEERVFFRHIGDRWYLENRKK